MFTYITSKILKFHGRHYLIWFALDFEEVDAIFYADFRLLLVTNALEDTEVGYFHQPQEIFVFFLCPALWRKCLVIGLVTPSKGRYRSWSPCRLGWRYTYNDIICFWTLNRVILIFMKCFWTEYMLILFGRWGFLFSQTIFELTLHNISWLF